MAEAPGLPGRAGGQAKPPHQGIDEGDILGRERLGIAAHPALAHFRCVHARLQPGRVEAARLLDLPHDLKRRLAGDPPLACG